MTLINRAAQRAIDQAAQGADDTLSIDYSASRTLRKLHNSDAFVKAVRGPIGCVAADTLILTERGPVPIAHIDRATRVVSWNATLGRFQLAPASAAFPKGRDALYRVRGPHGELRVAAHHRVLCEDGRYRQAQDLSRQGSFSAPVCSRSLIEKWLSESPSASPSGARRYWQTLVDYSARCESLFRRYGLRLLQAATVDQAFQPLPAGALTSGGGWSQEERNHQGQPSDLHAKQGCVHPEHTQALYRQLSALDPCSDTSNPASMLSHYDGSPAGPVPRFGPSRPGTGGWQNLIDLCSYEESLSDRATVSIIAPDSNTPVEEYWDLQVPDLHNYVTADGTIHHNSGKSVGCIMELVRLGLNQKPNKAGLRKSKWALVRSTYPELKSTTIKTFQEWVPDALCPVKMNDSPITARMALPLGDGTIAVIEFVFIALDKPKDLGKLLSLDLTGAFLNEAKELDKAVLDTVTSRVGRYPPIKKDGGPTWCGVILDTNSPSEDSWYAELENDPPDDWLFLKQPPALLRDSRHPSGFVPNKKAENISNLPGGHKYYYRSIAGKDANWVRAYVLNEFAAVRDGKPVYADTFNERVHVSSMPLWPVKDEPIYMGIDYGLTPAAVFGQLINGQLRILDELVATRLGLENFINDAINPLIAKKYSNHKIEYVGDPSGSSAKDTDERSCFSIMHTHNMPVIPASSNAIEPRLGAVRHFLTRMCGKGEPAFLLDPSCKVLKNGFINGYQFVRVQVAGEARFREKPDKNSYSHPHDACQYLCLRVLVAMKRKSQNKEAEGYRAVPVADTTTGY